MPVGYKIRSIKPILLLKPFYISNGHSYQRFGPRDILLIPPTIVNNFENNAVSLNNLERLGLLETNHVISITDESVYEAYRNLPYYQMAQQKHAQNPTVFSKVEVSTASFYITSYGEMFKSICL